VSASDVPSPDIYRLEHLFIVYVLGDFLLFWIVLGALSGHLFERAADFQNDAGLT
jgi:predicted cobalt transporter CbtA